MFDPVTLVVALAIAHIAGTGALVAVWVVNPEVPGILRWIAGRVLIGLSIAMLPLQVRLPETPIVVLAGTLTLCGILAVVTGSRQFMGRPPLPAWLLWGLPAVFALGLTALRQIQTDVLLQAILTSAAIAAACFINVESLWPRRGHPVRVSSRLMAAIFAIYGLFFLVRTIYSGTLPVPDSPGEPRWDVSVAVLASLVTSVLVATTYTAMVTEYLQADLKRQAERDPLTGLHNRRSFDLRATEAIRKAQRFRTALSLLYLDLDHFKAINDRHGHLAGDEVLRRLAEIIAASLRDSDLSARLGGEEFAVLLPRVDTAAAHAVAERIRQGMETCRIDGEGQPLQATVSIGLASLEHGADDLERLSRRADRALYLAKTAGRNRTVLAST